MPIVVVKIILVKYWFKIKIVFQLTGCYSPNTNKELENRGNSLPKLLDCFQSTIEPLRSTL